MVQGKLEERVAELERELSVLKELEREVSVLKARVDTLTPPTDWRGVIERFGGDEDLLSIFEAGRKIREEDRRRTKPKPSQSKRRAALMILLDSDHLTILIHPRSEKHTRLADRMAASADQAFATTIVNAEEQLRGWLAEINRYRTAHQQLSAYEGMHKYLELLCRFPLVAFAVPAADEFDRLRRMKVRIGSMDLKIASIAFVHNVLLLSANLRDFQQVPGLRVEDWLKE